MALKKKKLVSKDARRKLITAVDPKSPISEQYRTIRTNIQYSSIDQEIRTILVTSSGPGEGKSTTAANLAVTFAQLGKKVLLVDADLRKPTVHHTFGLNNLFGFTTVLTKQRTLEKTVLETEEQDLYILTSGPIPPNPAELLSSKSMEQFIEDAKAEFEYIIFDTPPLLAVSDPQILANQCDGSILVVFSEKTEIEKAKKSKELLENAQSKLLGVVLNNKDVKNNDYYYYYGSK
ncbi:CpsD/CapB family tyrosine-protein kinase [Bacillus sp. ISL-40]|uniref:CpsD/CapB family tyrosine-protein kinase n=1 Tax=unclassified Bacillus (in: firmicutes) TaxID=185979 RepID=UPI001BE80E84|nr:MULTISPECIES: CpsD/CapB family tyrosine-protein kinase [unclassified Bacillus (in: firmicutes)]MBT2701009.1 CpsD/CapB family tyrosine-protein kinase [Bacillus sp. ISL-40]MBT2739335.1 CpsD/CapB family tyrosine-protein kinase [Bacillus sp. ISL-77]